MNRSIAPEVKPFGHLVVPAENVEILANGISLHSVAGGDQPVSRLSIAFTGGAAELGSETMSSLLMSQFSEGTSARNVTQIADILDYNGARISVRPQAHHSVTDIWFLNDRAGELLPVWADCIANASYPDGPLETAKLRALSSYMSSRQDVAALAEEAFTEMMYGEGHVLGKPVTEESITSITSDSLRKIHGRIFNPAGIHAFLSGKEGDAVRRRVIELLESLPVSGSGFIPQILPMESPSVPAVRFVEKENAFQDAIMAGIAAPGREHADYIPLRLAVMALGGYFGSRLMMNVREEKGLTYGISAYLLGCREGSYVTVSAQCDCDNTALVIDEIKAEMRRLADNPPQGEELSRLKLHAATSLAEILDTPASIMGYYANRLYVGTPDDYFESQQAAINALSGEIIAEMASRYLQPDMLSVVVAGRKKK